MDQTSDSNQKEILALGQTTMLKLQKLKIIVYGLEGLGVEIIKNIGEYRPYELLVLDDTLVNKDDLEQGFIYRSEHIGKVKRQEICVNRFKSIFDNLNIKTSDNWKHEQMLIDQNIVNKYDLIVINHECDINKVYRLNEFCREQKRQIGLIYGQIFGPIGIMINDFGSQFKVYDKNGIEPSPFLISNISKSQQGIVIVNQEKKHNFQNGDFVRIFDVEGMVEVNGTDTRPIRVIDDYAFTIEDTREFSDYIKGGFVEVAKVPFKIIFKTIQQQFQELLPILSFQEQFNRQFLLNYKFDHVQDDIQIYKKTVIQKIFSFYSKHKRLPSNQEDCELIFQEVDSEVDNRHEIVDKICQFINVKTIMMSQHLGSIISMEILKYTGKFQPIRGFFQFDILDLVQNDWNNKSTNSIERLFGKDIYE